MDFAIKFVASVLVFVSAYNVADSFFVIGKVKKPVSVTNVVYALVFFVGLVFVCGRVLGGW